MITIKILATIFVLMQALFLIALKLVDSNFQSSQADKIILPIGFILTFIAIWI